MKKNLLFVAVMLLGMSNAFAQNTFALELNGDVTNYKVGNDLKVVVKDNVKLTSFLGATDYTVEFWLNPLDAVRNDQPKAVVSMWSGFQIQLTADDGLTFKIRVKDAQGNTSWEPVLASNAGIVVANQWQHIAVICNSIENSTKVYVNGVDQTDGAAMAHTMALESVDPGNQNFYINNGYGKMPMQVDNMRILTRAELVSNLETSDLKTSNGYTADAETALLLKFEEGSGVTTNELANNNSDFVSFRDKGMGMPTWVNLSSLSLAKNNTIEFGIFPNPSTNGFVTIQAQNNELLSSVEVFNTLGKSVRSISVKNNAKVSLNIQGLTQGLYFVRATTNNGIATQKLVVK